MKQLWFSVCLLTGSLLYSNTAPAQTATGALLQQMSSASRSLNYELAYISITKQGIESLRYRHALVEKQTLGQLLHMDGPRREVLQGGDGISYFEPGLVNRTQTHRCELVPVAEKILDVLFDCQASSPHFGRIGRAKRRTG